MKRTETTKTRIKILHAINGAKIATPDLAKLVGLERDVTRRICKGLKEDGLVDSSLGGKPGLLCVDCKKAVTRETYKECEEEGHEIRTMTIPTLIWRLTAAGNRKVVRA